MQMVVQVLCTKGQSLRDAIAKDSKIEDYSLCVSEQRRVGRNRGWTKVHSLQQDRYGAINIEWLSSSQMLLCRVVTRGNGKPGLIIGDFTDYLLNRHFTRIQSINIVPR